MSKFKQAMETYRKRPLSLFLRIVVIAAAVITAFILGAIIIYILVKGIPNLSPELFAWEYNTDNVSMTPLLSILY